MTQPTDNDKKQLLEWMRAGFADLERDDLKKAAEMLSVEYAPTTNNETLRKKLREAIGTVEGTLPPPSVEAIAAAAPKPAAAGFTLSSTPPNLGPSGRWGGRYRRVRLSKTDYYQNFVGFPISWEGQIKYFHFDTELDMPWPYYEALRNMIEIQVSKDLSADGRSVITKETRRPVIPFSDLGDTPGTEGLPCSMIEYVQEVAKSSSHFAGATRRDLVRVMRWLHGPQTNVTTKEMSDEEIRDELLTFIGVDIYADA
ncbi:MAG: hypothetical protein GAK28_00628 [Luteibacter sp.]|uniref:hypothetical protein n=1 Tax=Luteibacter sp. TaxID=1886636 RepID=UPI001383052E|nr:hypothetical protein [Luteibacter sp.]KAF1008996.1 MAG: hypothetical protein GAK28_00628 [Luteibacter sp.]